MSERTFYIRFYPDGLDEEGVPFITANEDKECPLVPGAGGIRIKMVIPGPPQVEVY